MTVSEFTGCLAYDPERGTQYGYKPTLATGIVFCVLFFLSMSAHFWQTWHKRMWWTLVFGIGALTELLGWGARTWASQCPLNLDAFLMQITTLIIAPTFFTAGIYIILGRLIRHFGPATRPIGATTYLRVFCTCDILSLVVQAIGGAMASQAVQQDPPGNSERGTHIMVGGIVFQMASISVFVVLFVEFLRRVGKLHRNGGSSDTLGTRAKILVGATAFSGALIYVRSIYRTIELLQGWRGYLITHENYFIGLDAIMMLLAVAIFNFIHPGWFLPEDNVVETEGREQSETKAREDVSDTA